MAVPVIRVKDLRKIYRLYAKPSYRFLDMFGMLRHRDGAYTEHAALDGITLDIARGEKVAIIGRNGAGKSTFLKLVTKVVEPTSGVLDVQGDVHALLTMGSGFHPDFTGRENARAYLAQLGVTGADAERRCAEAIEFAELEEYIDQPVKTYSTGMGVRLMFAVSTAIAPDLLVVDEVLSVGDTYFSRKSFDRMRELCEGNGATLLLVTHDVYSAARMCDRIIWIDRGRVLMDGQAALVVKAYEDSIRQQEERRLRLKKDAQMKAVTSRTARYVTIEIRARGNRPPASAVYFAEIALLAGGTAAALPLDRDPLPRAERSHLVSEATCWGGFEAWQGRPARSMLNFGSPFHKVSGLVEVPAAVDAAALKSSTVRLTLGADVPSPLVVRGFVDGVEIDFGEVTPPAGRWDVVELRPVSKGGAADAAAEINTTGVHGTGVFTIVDVDVLDESGTPSLVLPHGRPASFVIDYAIADPAFRGHAQVIIAVYHDGVQTACRFGTNALEFDASTQSAGRIRLDVPALNLGVGTYSLGVMIAERGYLDREQTTFYTINASVYASLIGVTEFTVTGEGLMPTNTAWVGSGHWSVGNAEKTS